MERRTAEIRAALLQAIRNFFIERSYLEVVTPCLTPSVIPEARIAPFSTEYLRHNGRADRLHLVPSPEVYLKRLVGAGFGSLFQIARAFRNTDSIGNLHNPEFTMLEWYTVDSEYREAIRITEQLMACLAGKLDRYSEAGPGLELLTSPFLVVTVDRAFRDWAGIDLESCMRVEQFKRAAEASGVRCGSGDDWETVFDRVVIERIEPSIPRDRPVLLIDYPNAVPTLARSRDGTPWSERWELYLRGIEIVNCYSEETRSERVRSFFETEIGRLGPDAANREVDLSYPAVFHGSYPTCSGGAMGLDRLLMTVLDKRHISDVLFFPL